MLAGDAQTVAPARRLRRALTPPEIQLWQALRQRPQGFKFRRQHPSGPYIADFYCHEARLIVEVDGQQHGLSAAIARDAGRDEYFRLRGIRTMRFSAATVARDFEAVVATIAHTAATRTPLRTCSPPLQGEATRGKAAAGGVSPSPQRD